MIVKEREIQRRIAQDFPQCRVIRVYIYSDRERIQDRLKSDGYSDDQVNFRLGRIKESWFDYIDQKQSYDEIIINNSTRDDFHKIVDSLIAKYEGYPADVFCVDNQHQYPLIDPLLGHKTQMFDRLQKFPFEKNVFLMMKFRRKNQGLSSLIKTTLKAEGLNPVRADDDGWNITKNVYNPLAVLYCCKYGIALFDTPEKGSNFSPNVAYELGFMQLQRKTTLILVHKKLPSVPFDFIKDLHVSYATPESATNEVKRWVNHTL